MRYDDNTGGDGFGCIGIYTLAAFVLFIARWLGIIQWSWWVVLAPLYIPPAIILTMALIDIITGGTK